MPSYTMQIHIIFLWQRWEFNLNSFDGKEIEICISHVVHPNSYLVINKFIVLADISKSKKEKEKSNYLKWKYKVPGWRTLFRNTVSRSEEDRSTFWREVSYPIYSSQYFLKRNFPIPCYSLSTYLFFSTFFLREMDDSIHNYESTYHKPV